MFFTLFFALERENACRTAVGDPNLPQLHAFRVLAYCAAYKIRLREFPNNRPFKLPSFNNFGYCLIFDVQLRLDALVTVPLFWGTGMLSILSRVTGQLKVRCAGSTVVTFNTFRMRHAQQVLVVAFFGVCLLFF
jgi:hypothetical protein